MCQNFSKVALHSRNLFFLLNHMYFKYMLAHVNLTLLCTGKNNKTKKLKDTKKGTVFKNSKNNMAPFWCLKIH